MKVNLHEVIHELEECFKITDNNRHKYEAMYQRLGSLFSDEKTFGDGVLYSVCRIVEIANEPGLAAEILSTAMNVEDLSLKLVDISDRKFMKKILKEIK